MRPKLMDWEGEKLPKIDEIWMLARIKNSLKNRWFWRPQLKKIITKTLPQTISFSHAFFIDFGEVLGGFWESLGRGLGDPWRLLGHF